MQRKRHTNDLYRTATPVTECLLSKVKIEGSVLEPCAGHGDIAKLFPNCTSNDIDTTLPWACQHYLDAAIAQSWEVLGDRDWVVTNPPFNCAESILFHAWDNARIGVAFLLRLTFLEPTKTRGGWLDNRKDNFYKIIPVNPRVQFRADTGGSDNVTVAWFVWRKDWSWNALGLECPIDFIREWR